MQKTQVQSLGWEDPLEKEMATHSSILAWEIPWTKELGRLQSTGLQKVRHNLVTQQQQKPIDIDTPEWNFMLEIFYFLFSNIVTTTYMLSIEPLKCGWYN